MVYLLCAMVISLYVVVTSVYILLTLILKYSLLQRRKIAFKNVSQEEQPIRIMTMFLRRQYGRTLDCVNNKYSTNVYLTLSIYHQHAEIFIRSGKDMT